MRRTFRHRAAPFGASGTSVRLSSMVVMMVVVAMLYYRAKDPAMWTWLAPNAEPAQDAADPQPPAKAATQVETIVPGPTDRDEAEQADAAKQFEALTDRSELSAPEMPAYWRLIRWAGAQSFAELKRRAGDATYAHLYQDPDRYRGKLFRLRLHVRRNLQYPAPENSAGVETVCEAWGYTDESKSYPYVVVFSEKPAAMPVGPEVHFEGEFVGYFMKTTAYPTFDDKVRAAPLLIGRMRLVETPAIPRNSNLLQLPWWMWAAGVGALLLIMAIVARQRRSARPPHAFVPAADDAAMADFLGSNGDRVEPSTGHDKRLP